jgi:hypothetical protein
MTKIPSGRWFTKALLGLGRACRQLSRELPEVMDDPQWILIRTVTSTEGAKFMSKPHLRLVTPAAVNRTVTPRRAPNRDLRTREYLTPDEVERSRATAGDTATRQ